MASWIERTATKEKATRRTRVVRYHMIDASGVVQKVCKIFFLATLGYSSTSSVVNELLKSFPPSKISPPGDKRGKHEPKHALGDDTKQLIISHIRSYNPCISHYRRAHAPKRLYLPSELTEKDMHQDFVKKYPHIRCSYVSYHRCIRSLNISFVKLGEEDCELCMELSILAHDKRCEFGGQCSTCIRRSLHEELFKEARQLYVSEADNIKDGKMVRSVDLQKVIMLPRLPGVKTVCFTRRIIAFHLTFAPVNGYTKLDVPTTSITWHEGLAGRKCEDITSMYVKALLMDRDYTEITYWMDNCSAQNKNWSLITAMVRLVNGPHIAAETITFRYLEAGHTFMSADSIHAGVEKQMKAMKHVYDFDDFARCVEKGGKVKLVIPVNDDFRDYKGEQSQPKINKKDRPKLADCRQIQFRRGSTSFFAKLRHSDDDFISVDFLKKKAKMELPEPLRQSARGIPVTKKVDILQKLCPLMPESRRIFWERLVVAEVCDLIDEDEDETNS